MTIPDKTRIPIKCDCHGKQVMAERVDDTIVIIKESHGVLHTAVIPLTDGQKPCENDETVEAHPPPLT